MKTNKNIMDSEMVLIEWLDCISQNSPGWHDLDFINEPFPVIKTVGFIVKDTDKELAVVGDIGQMGSQVLVAAARRIPRSQVLKVTPLNRKKA